jgi:hypothetical protein
VYAWKNVHTSTKKKLCGALFPSIDGKLFAFATQGSLVGANWFLAGPEVEKRGPAVLMLI